MKTRIVVFGSGAFGRPSFSALADADNVEIAAVVSQPARPAGRQRVLTPTPIATWAQEQSLPILTPERLRGNSQVEEKLKKIEAHCFIVADYGLILPPTVLAIPKAGCVNIHGSLLPLYRGAAPVAFAIADGQATTGVTLMLMDDGLDTGPILSQYSLPLSGHEFRSDVEDALADLAARHIVKDIRRYWAGQLQPQPQDHVHASLAPKLTPDAGRADWSSAGLLERKIRAFTPWPGVWTTWRDQRIKLLAATIAPGRSTSAPGTVEDVAGQWGISCTDGWLLPTKVQFSGKQVQSAASIPGSYPGFIGTRLGI